MRRILVVDDNPADRFACRRILNVRSWTVSEAETPEAAVALLDAEEFECVLSDYNLKSPKDGIDVLAHALQARPSARRVLMSGFFTPGVVELAQSRAQIHASIEKPDEPAAWAAALDDAVAHPPSKLGGAAPDAR